MPMSAFSKEFLEGLNKDNVEPLSRRILSDSEIDRRFGFHPGTEITAPMHDRTRLAFKDVAWFVDTYVPSTEESARAKALCLTCIEEASMWAQKAIANSSLTEREVGHVESAAAEDKAVKDAEKEADNE